MFSETVRRAGAGGWSDKKSLSGLRWVLKAAAGVAVAAALVMAVAIGTSYYSRPSSTLVVALSELDAAAGPFRRFEPRFTVLADVSSARAGDALCGAECGKSRLRFGRRPRGWRRRRHLERGFRRSGHSRRLISRRVSLRAPPSMLTPLAASANEAGLLNDIAAAYLSRGAGGDAEQALQLLERAATLEPARAEVWFNLGLAAEKTGRLSRAAEAWNRYLELNPSSGWAADARRHLDTRKR